MANLEWALSCDYAFYDKNGKICIIGVFDRIWADSFPVMHSLFYVVSWWKGEPAETFNERTRIVAADGTQVSETHGIEVTTSPGGGAGITSRFLNARFEEPGSYRIEFLVDDEVIDSIPLTLAPTDRSSQREA